jgi:hypothetical protein
MQAACINQGYSLDVPNGDIRKGQLSIRTVTYIGHNSSQMADRSNVALARQSCQGSQVWTMRQTVLACVMHLRPTYVVS